MSKLKLVGIVAAVALTAAYAASPYWAVNELRAAAQARDADTMAQYIDFPAVRTSMKNQISARLIKGAVDEGGNEPLAGVAGVFVSAFVEKVVDAMVTPEGLALMFETGNSPAPSSNGASKKSSGERPGGVKVSTKRAPSPTPANQDVRITQGYSGLNTFDVVLVGTTGPEKMQLRFERDGLWGWKLRSVRLPL